ncbi:hypothetical protein [Ideonella livida]|uniref:Uncharacterized protein n=1 Tax=Ideonella livida TaxID=2707176 RepID=A0A7C9TLC2_9BURK|nr:hypothetical protein [Ideonella livida]NDY91925.1 hypothetical protein [Ideonella livida]
MARHPGVLLTGGAPDNQAGRLVLQQAELLGAWRWHESWAGAWSLAGHDGEPLRTESALVETRHQIAGAQWALRLGRQPMGLGDVVDGAARLQDYGQKPLAHRAALGDAEPEDGLRLSWRPPPEDGWQALSVGLWRGRGFPGSQAGAWAPSLLAQWGHGHATLHGLAAHWRPQARGATALMADGMPAHHHGVPDCRDTTTGRVCFSGRSTVLGVSAAVDGWMADRLLLQGAWLWRRERGALYDATREAELRSDVQGAWVDLQWRWGEDWRTGGRLERLVPRNRVAGRAPAELAAAAGLAEAVAVHRATATLQWRWQQALGLTLEVGQERASGQSPQPWGALRLTWDRPTLLEGH